MSHRPFKQRIYAEFARIGNALASDRRLELLDLLAQTPRHVEALAAETETPVANVSQHLQVLRAARLVEAEKEGTKVRYRLADDSVIRLWLALRDVAESRLAEVPLLRQQYGLAGGDLEALPGDQLERLLNDEQAVLIDVRPQLEYEDGHIPGAIAVPIEELPSRLDELPRDRPIVAYCRGKYCLFADEAVALLREHGFEAVRLSGGWPEWKMESQARPSDESSDAP